MFILPVEMGKPDKTERPICGLLVFVLASGTKFS